MLLTVARCVMIACILLPFAARGEPIRLKPAYYASDRTRSYSMAIKPFVDAVNADEAAGLAIDAFPGGALGKESAQQAHLVRDGVADIAFVVLGTAPSQFRDHGRHSYPCPDRVARGFAGQAHSRE